MLIDLSPLKNNKQFRLLFLGQTISYLGSMMTYVAIPYQVYQITKDSFWVGLVATVQLIPLLIAGLYGGALADATDRRRLLIISEWGLFVCSVLMVFNAASAHPQLWILIALSGVSSALTGIHRPAMDALLPQIVASKDMISATAIGSLRYAFAAVAGPGLGGILIAQFGAQITFAIDAATFLVSILCLQAMHSVPIPNSENKVSLSSIIEGMRYAKGDPIIVGTYLVDIIAMVFAMPIALFPQLVDEISAKPQLGLLYAAIPLGGGLISIFSKQLQKISRHGSAVILAASFWGVFVFLVAFSPNVWWILAFLVLAGAADGISAIFRQTIWNDTIPTGIRGRLASLNMLSYMVGPLLGHSRAGTMASMTSTGFSIWMGGIVCAITCFMCIWLFPTFWSYRKQNNS